jgi:hypothetical protein
MQADWNALGEVLYRKWHVYDMGWGETQIEDYNICGAPFGGPLATLLNDRKLVALSGENAKPKLRIYSSAGKKLSEVLCISCFFLYIKFQIH